LKTIVACLLLLVALSSAAQSKPHVYYVPAVAHAGGVNGSFFVSNLRVFNAGTATANVDAFLLGTGDNSAATPATFTVAVNRAAKYDDVLPALFSRTGGAALRLESDQPLLVSSHLENVNTLCPDREGKTGQYLPGVARASAALRQRLPHLTYDDAHRANFGAVNTAGTTANLTIVLRDLDSGQVAAEGILTLPPHGWAQVNNIVEQAFLFDPLPNGMIEVTSDVPVITYLSLIDNRTNDAFTVVGTAVE
jgi:hypothetical protein